MLSYKTVISLADNYFNFTSILQCLRPLPSFSISAASLLPRLRFIQDRQKQLWQKSHPYNLPPSPHQRHCSSVPSVSLVNGPLLRNL